MKLTTKCIQMIVVMVALGAAVQPPSAAHARPYKVVSCDSAEHFGHSSAAWMPFGTAGRAYSTCPSGGGDVAGISNRLTGSQYAGSAGSAHAFDAPAGTTITSIRWGGRMARDSCDWGVYIRALPSESPVVGMPNAQYCGTNGLDTRRFPFTFPVPGGTTRLEQLVICGAPWCDPGATIHSQEVEVTLEDHVPPRIALSGPLASGQWVSGKVGEPHVQIDGTDGAGIQRVEAVLALPSPGSPTCATGRDATPCAGRVSYAAAPRLAQLAGRTTSTPRVRRGCGRQRERRRRRRQRRQHAT